MPRANWEFIGNMEIIIPNINKQQEIIDYLDKKTEDIDKTIKKINQSINLLTEYKSSLISHVVTGKVKI
jgi:type I restriction enzyme S subunit